MFVYDEVMNTRAMPPSCQQETARPFPNGASWFYRAACGLALAWGSLTGSALAQDFPGTLDGRPNTLTPALQEKVRQLVMDAVSHGQNRQGQGMSLIPPAPQAQQQARPNLRMELVMGELDARLRLAPCKRVEAFVPGTSSLWGRSRVGLRCREGAVPWTVYLPVQVKAWGPALAAITPLPHGKTLESKDFAQVEVDWAEDASAVVSDMSTMVGRVLSRALSPGEALRAGHMRPRQWFAIGDMVRIRAAGDGFAISGMAEAITPGIEGQPARVRTENGRVLSGQAVADKQMEIAL